MVSGIVRINLYPLAAAAIAKAIPVFPDVGSTRIVLPGAINPSFSAAVIILTPILSFTDDEGFILSSFTKIFATQPNS